MEDIRSDDIVIGVDQPKDEHVAVALNGLGGRLGVSAFRAASDGYGALEDWARLWRRSPFGIDGPTSCGAGLARSLRASNAGEVIYNRQRRYSGVGYLTPAQAYEQMAGAA